MRIVQDDLVTAEAASRSRKDCKRIHMCPGSAAIGGGGSKPVTSHHPLALVCCCRGIINAARQTWCIGGVELDIMQKREWHYVSPLCSAQDTWLVMGF